LLRKTPRPAVAALVAAAALLSILFSQWAVSSHASVAFYLLPSRIWELLVGALLVLAPPPRPGARVISHGLGLAGLAMVLGSVVFMSPTTPFPGLYAAIPCLGAGLILYAGPGEFSVANRALSFPWMVAIGLISYSLYLWHWPLLVLGEYYALAGLTALEKVALITAAGAMAALSWKYVELPFRRGLLSRRQLFAAAAGVTLLAVAAGAALVLLGGIPGRFSPAILNLLPTRDAHRASMSCPGQPRVLDRVAMRCPLGPPGAPPDFYVLGDSHAAALAPAFQIAAMKSGRGGMLASNSGCAPLMGARPAAQPACRRFTDNAIRAALAPGIRDVILVGIWARDAEGSAYGRQTKKRLVLIDDRSGAPGPDNHRVFAAALERTIKTLHDGGKRVILVESEPEMGVVVPQTMAKIRLLHSDFAFAPTTDAYLKRQAFVMQLTERLRARYGVVLVFPHRVLCATQTCLSQLAGKPLYLDENHLNAAGAALLADLLTSTLESRASGVELPDQSTGQRPKSLAPNSLAR